MTSTGLPQSASSATATTASATATAPRRAPYAGPTAETILIRWEVLAIISGSLTCQLLASLLAFQLTAWPLMLCAVLFGTLATLGVNALGEIIASRRSAQLEHRLGSAMYQLTRWRMMSGVVFGTTFANSVLLAVADTSLSFRRFCLVAMCGCLTSIALWAWGEYIAHRLR